MPHRVTRRETRRIPPKLMYNPSVIQLYHPVHKTMFPRKPPTCLPCRGQQILNLYGRQAALVEAHAMVRDELMEGEALGASG